MRQVDTRYKWYDLERYGKKQLCTEKISVARLCFLRVMDVSVNDQFVKLDLYSLAFGPFRK